MKTFSNIMFFVFVFVFVFCNVDFDYHSIKWVQYCFNSPLKGEANKKLMSSHLNCRHNLGSDFVLRQRIQLMPKQEQPFCVIKHHTDRQLVRVIQTLKRAVVRHLRWSGVQSYVYHSLALFLQILLCKLCTFRGKQACHWGDTLTRTILYQGAC